MAKLLLLDGNSLTYRAFYAVPDTMANSAGETTNAVFGFTSMLVSLIRDQRPDGLAVCFDRPEPTFRHERNPEYKAQRDSAPPELISQLGIVKQLLEALNAPVVELAGFEADDLLATLASSAAANGDEAVIVSGDRDTFQLPQDPGVSVLYTQRGVSQYVLLDEAGVADKTGVHPSKYTQYAAMRGDSSDNLPGVPGVGEKTAAKLLNEHGDIDGIFANLESLTPKLRQNLGDSEAVVRENLTLMTLQTDAPVKEDVAELRWREPNTKALLKLFAELEFTDMYRRLTDAAQDTPLQALLAAAEPASETASADTSASSTTEELNVKAVVPPSAAAAVQRLAKVTTPVAVAYQLNPSDAAELQELAVLVDDQTAIYLDEAILSDAAIANELQKIFASDLVVDVHHAKPLVGALAASKCAFSALGIDTHLVAYLVDPGTSKATLGDLLMRFCNRTLPQQPEQSSLDVDTASTKPKQAVADRLATQALAVRLLALALEQTLQEQGMAELYADIERPLIAVLQRMEARGVGVNDAELTTFAADLAAESVVLEEEITKQAGRQFNIKSPKELSAVLFEELGLTPGKKTARGGFSTDAATLEAIRSEHPIVEQVLHYREVTKLQSTCEKTLLSEVEADGRIHATFHQTGSRTGRLSSEHPNLHAIPVRGEQGRRVRRAFVPREGFEMLVADYNQIELRVVAHLSQDPGLIEMFASSEDVHQQTAAAVFGVAPTKVTADMRNKAKMVSYGLIYGMEAFGLGQRLGIETREAAKILDAYFEAFSGVKNFMTEVVEQSRESGYTETMFGRRRPIPELRSRNHQVRRAAERQAMNAPVQGLAADIFKIALVRLDAALEEKKSASSLVLQIHDEVVLEVPPDERDTALELTTSTMSRAVELSVPLEVVASFGPSWADAKN